MSAPVRARLRQAMRATLALAAGGAGGLLFVWLGTPLPWMLGAMAAGTIAALMRAPIASPIAVRPPMHAVLGVLLGASFTPETLAGAAHWLPTIAGLFLFIVASGATTMVYLRYVAGVDWVTAYFAGMPSGLTEMVLAGEKHGADTRIVALSHSARILLIVFCMPFVVQFLSEDSAGTTLGTDAVSAGLSMADIAWLAGCAVSGLWLARQLKLPAGPLMGPLLVSAVVHGLGLTTFVPHPVLVAIAQVVVGTTIGCRFVGASPRQILEILAYSVGSTLIFAGFTLAFSFALAWMVDVDVIALILAYSPGGLTEMGLIALSLQIEIAFVTVHHVLRLATVMLFAPVVFSILAPKHKSQTPASRQD